MISNCVCVISFSQVSAASKLIHALGKVGAKVDYLLDDSGKTLKAKKRWLPLFAKIQHLVKSKDTINQICSEEGLEQLTPYHWQRLDKFVTLFAPFKLVKDQQNVMNETTISRVIPSVLFLEKHLTKQATDTDYEVRDLASTLQFAVNSKLNYLWEPQAESFDEIYLVATYLDPAVQKVLSREQQQLALTYLENFYQTFYGHEATTSDTDGQRKCADKDDEEPDTFEQFLNDSSTIAQTKSAVLSSEIAAYQDLLARRTIPHKTDPLDFWASEPLNLPILQRLAFDILPVPSNAYAIEQLFILAGYASEGMRAITSHC